MAGHRFVVGGDPAAARDTVYAVLESQGFKLNRTSDWSATAERGSKGMSMAFGALAGKSGRYVQVIVGCTVDDQGNVIVTLQQGASGFSGGLVGLNQANQIYNDIYTVVGTAYQNAGVLVTGGPA